MRSRELEKLVRQLEERKVQIIHNIRETAREMESFAEAEVNDEGDYAAISTDSLIDTAITQKQMQELKEIEYALSKVSKGTFGTCEMCGEPVGIERMRVKPHARFCIVCREAYEKNGNHH